MKPHKVLLIVPNLCLLFLLVNSQVSVHPPAVLTLWTRTFNATIDYFNMYLINVEQPVKFVVHGYLQSTRLPVFTNIVNSYLIRGNYNVITVDYPEIANLTFAECYARIHIVEFYLVGFIKELNYNLGIEPGNLHVVGHSLGGQIAGRLGNLYYKLTGQKLGRVTCLDPAKMGFDSILVPNDFKANAESAVRVDVVHTDIRTVGAMGTAGTIDYYVNGGFGPQPGCILGATHELIGNIPLLDGWIVPLNSDNMCSHVRSVRLYAHSILSEDLRATSCLDWDMMRGICLTPGNRSVIFGEDAPANATGIYYFDTTAQPPYVIRNGTALNNNNQNQNRSNSSTVNTTNNNGTLIA